MADLTVSSDIDSFMAAANQVAMRTAIGLGSIATQAASSIAITGGTLAGLTGLAIRSTGATFDLTFATSEVLTGAKTLSFNVGDTNRTLTLSGSPTISGITTTGTGTIATGTFTLTVAATGTAALLGVAQTFTAANIFSVAGAASTPALSITGSWISGGTATTNKPMLLVEESGATSTGWVNGTSNKTGLGVNCAASAVVTLMDLQENGVSRFKFISGSASSKALVVPTGFLLSVGSASLGMAQFSSIVGVGIDRLTDYTNNNTFLLLSPGNVAAKIQMGVDAAGVVNQFFTAASRITSNGAGANLTISGGNCRGTTGEGGVGGSLILSTYAASATTNTVGTLTTRMTITTTGAIILESLPTSDPGVSGQLYKSAGVVMQSA